jgi:hypothetical protein
MRGKRNAGAITDFAVELPAGLGTGGHADRLGHRRHREMTTATQDLVLCAFVEPRAQLQGMRRGQAPTPCRGWTAASELHRHFDERRYVELVSAVAARDIEPVEAGVDEVLVQILGVMRPILGCRLPVDESRAERARAGLRAVK